MERGTPVNIYDIAKKSGVSIATVSRVLNNSPHVRAQTREKVLAVMQQESYAPNAFARGLGFGTMGMVGVLCTDVRDPFYAEAVGYVEERLRQQGMHAILRCTGSALEDKQAALEALVRENVDAVILIGSAFREDTDNRHIAAAAQRLPVIIINGYVALPGVYCITCDERRAVQELVESLFHRQIRRILFLHDSMTYSSQQKIAGYRDGCAACGEPAQDDRIVQVERRMDAVNACIKRLLVQRVSFDAVIGSEDILAVAAQKSLQRIGINMPVIGFNNSILAQCCTPELSSVDNALEDMCAAALDTLGTLLEHRAAQAHIVIPARLVERDSFRIQ